MDRPPPTMAGRLRRYASREIVRIHTAPAAT